MKTIVKKINLKEARKMAPKQKSSIPNTQILLRQLYHITGWANSTVISDELRRISINITPSNISSVLNALRKKLGDEILERSYFNRRMHYRLSADAKKLGPDDIYSIYYLGRPGEVPNETTETEEQNPEFIETMDKNAELLEDHTKRDSKSSDIAISLKIQGKINFIFSVENS